MDKAVTVSTFQESEPDQPHLNLDTTLCDHLAELVICCDSSGKILYANPMVQALSDMLLVGHPFCMVLTPDAAQKGADFFVAARVATPQNPTIPWELSLGKSTAYVVATFQGYKYGDQIWLVGQSESEHISRMQQELLDLTSELAEAQRQLHRQNRALQQALSEQRHLLQTIQELTAPASPIADGVLLLPLVGHMDSYRIKNIVTELLKRVEDSRVNYVILDATSIAMIDTAVARYLIDAAHAIRLLGAHTVLVGVTPATAQSVVHLGIDLRGFIMHSDLQHAIADVLRRRNRSHR